MSFKILSLDGGGSWALIQAKVLQDIYGNIRGHELLRKFDLAIANSGGSLVLACLCNDMYLADICSVFEDENSRKQVFASLSFLDKLIIRQDRVGLLRGLLGIGPRYYTRKKLEGLINVLSEKDHLKPNGKPIVNTPMNELPKIIGKPNLQLLIVGFDYFRQRVSFFRSNMNSNTDVFSDKYFGMPLAHAIHCSSNAPVNYFDAPAEVKPFIFQKKPDFTEPVYTNTTWFWDGAVSGFNNPVLGGLIEAMTNGADPKDCCILSIGTGTGSKVVLTDVGTSTNPDDQKRYELNKKNELVNTDASFKFKNDISKIAGSILDDPPDSATFITYSIMDPTLTGKAKLVRINPCYSPVYNSTTKIYELPEVYKGDMKTFKAVLDLDMDAVEPRQIDLIKDLCKKFITDSNVCLANQLIRGDVSGKYLGQPTYKKAKDDWSNCL
jgi:patatin-like phospholipase